MMRFGETCTGLIEAAPCVWGRGAPGPAADGNANRKRMEWWGVKLAKNSVDALAKPVSTKKTRNDRGDGAMSSSIRDLILSFGVVDSDPAWDPNAYARRSAA